MMRDARCENREPAVALMAAVLAAALCLSCAGGAALVERGGRALDGAAFAEKTVARYRAGPKKHRVEVFLTRDRAGAESLVLRADDFPALTLRGTAPGGEGGEFEFTEARVLSSSLFGWNDFSLDVLGSGSFTLRGDAALLRLSPPERVGVSAGAIRLKDRRIAGEDALASLRSRRERILALVDRMRESPPDWELPHQKAFELYWQSRLPAGLYDEAALRRDWEEALPWIYLEYNWDTIIMSFDNLELVRVK